LVVGKYQKILKERFIKKKSGWVKMELFDSNYLPVIVLCQTDFRRELGSLKDRNQDQTQKLPLNGHHR
jgi:hypothetical protein